MADTSMHQLGTQNEKGCPLATKQLDTELKKISFDQNVTIPWGSKVQ